MAFSLPEWPGARAGSEEGELFSQARKWDNNSSSISSIFIDKIYSPN